MCFLKASINFDSSTITDGGEIFKPESMYAIIAGHFPIWHLFRVIVLSEWICIFAFVLSLISSNSFSILLINLAFLLSWLPYFAPKLFFFSYIRLLVCLRDNSPTC